MTVATRETTIVPTHQTATTEYVEARGIRFAYRRLGSRLGRPLVLLQHFTGTMDNWDPMVVDRLAQDRPVILFNNTGISSTSGETPDTVAAMARDAEAFIDALGLESVDIFGFSLGGMIAQQITVDRPALVRRLLLVGTGPRGGDGMAAFTPEVNHFFFEKQYPSPEELWLDIFFAPTPTSQATGQAFLTRLRTRQIDRDPASTLQTAQAQLAAVAEWGAPHDGSYAYLQEITQPVLVVNGSNDIIIPTINSYVLQQELPNAQLIVYPDSNHGSQYQFPELFLAQVRLFLSS